MTLIGEHLERDLAGHEAAVGDDAARWISLARRIHEGDGSAEADLVRQFHARVRMVASIRLHGSDAAADIAQETMLAVLEALRAGRVREPEKLPSFVSGIARNLINNYCRKVARNPELPLDSCAEPTDPSSSPAESDETRRTVVRAFLKRLNPVDRRILTLTLVEGMTPREIAPIVGLKPEIVRTRKARAVKAVSDEIRNVTRKRRLGHIGTSGLRT